MISTPFGASFLIAIIGLSIGCTKSAPRSTSAPHLIERSRVAMGSTLRLTAWSTDETAVLPAFDDVFSEFARLEKLMSTWIPESDVVRINRSAGVRPEPVAAEVRDVLETARQVSEWTNGKFAVTFGALAGLWRFDHDQDNVIPDMREVRRRLPGTTARHAASAFAAAGRERSL